MVREEALSVLQQADGHLSRPHDERDGPRMGEPHESCIRPKACRRWHMPVVRTPNHDRLEDPDAPLRIGPRDHEQILLLVKRTRVVKHRRWDAVQITRAAKEVSRDGAAWRDFFQGRQRVGQGVQGEEDPGASENEVASSSTSSVAPGIAMTVHARLFALASVASVLLVSCPPPPPPPVTCASISIPAVPGPASGTQTVCTLPSDCREDSTAVPIDTLLCNDKSKAYCPSGTSSCNLKQTCVGVVVSSGLVVPPNSCTWDRNTECKTPSGGAGSNCTCKWTIPAGSSLSCGCGCQ